MTPFLMSSDGGSKEKVRVLGPCTAISKFSGGPSGAVAMQNEILHDL